MLLALLNHARKEQARARIKPLPVDSLPLFHFHHHHHNSQLTTPNRASTTSRYLRWLPIKRRSHTAQQASASSSNGAKNLASSDVACLNAALALYKATGANQFLKLAQDVTGRHLATPRGQNADEDEAAAAMKTIRKLFDPECEALNLGKAKKAADACQTLWPDESFIALDHQIILTLANSENGTKDLIPPSYYRASTTASSELAKQNPEYRIDEHCQTEYGDEADQMIQDPSEKAQAVLRSRQDPQPKLLGVGEFKHGKKLGSQIMEQIKLISDSITADADKIIDSEKQAFQGLESLVAQLCESPQPQGNDTANVFRDICEISMSQSCESLESLKAKVQAMSKFLEGSIEILKDSGDSSN